MGDHSRGRLLSPADPAFVVRPSREVTTLPHSPRPRLRILTGILAIVASVLALANFTDPGRPGQLDGLFPFAMTIAAALCTVETLYPARRCLDMAAGVAFGGAATLRFIALCVEEVEALHDGMRWTSFANGMCGWALVAALAHYAYNGLVIPRGAFLRRPSPADE